MSISIASASVPVLTTKSLHQIVNQLAGNLRLSAIKRNSFIINEVSTTLQIESNKNLLSSLVNQLLISVVDSSNQGCIRIGAKEYDDVIFITIKDNSGMLNGTLDSNLDNIKTLARKMYGTLTINKTDNTINSILLSFPNFNVVV